MEKITNTIILTVVVLSVVGGLGYFLFTNFVDSSTENINTTGETTPAEQMNTERETVSEASTTTGVSGEFIPYDEAKLQRAEEGKVVLFFSAEWCTTCQALKQNINTNLDNIPEDVTIMELDYDAELQKRKRYDVLLQHTLIQVDENGDEIDSWIGLNTLESIISRLH